MKVIKPNSQIQLDALRSNCDIVWLVGVGGSGKTFIACDYNSKDILEDKEFKAIYIRKNISQFFTSGGIADTLASIYPLIEDGKVAPKRPIGTLIRSQQKMGVNFFNGATIKFIQISDENPEKLKDQFKGSQPDRFLVDETDAFDYNSIFYIITRLRGRVGKKQQLILIQNPERDCFGRTMLGTKWNGVTGAGYIDEEGNFKPEMNGTVVYFFNKSKDKRIDGIVYGKTKKEVYEACKPEIDAILKSKRRFTYNDLIMSMSAFSFSMDDNESLDASYAGKLFASVAAGAMAENNWNYSSKDQNKEDSGEIRLNYSDISNCFKETYHTTGKITITCDPASEGEDNLVLCAWDGFHLIGIKIVETIKAWEQEYPIREFMNRYGATNKDLALDIQRYEHLKKPFAGATFFNGTEKCSNLGKKSFSRLKDEASYQMVRLVLAGIITVDKKLQFEKYTHQKSIRKDHTLFDEMVFESKVFEFKKLDNGLLKVLNKDEMGKLLNGKSPDLMDNFVILVGAKIYDVYRLLSNVQGFKVKLEKNAQIDNLGSNIMLNRNPQEDDNSARGKLKLKSISASQFFKIKR